MTKTPKISVLMPVYNTQEDYLREAIESILSQSFADFEFIIINDGSTNNAEDVIMSYKDARIRYYKQENKGLSITRNRLLDLAQGEYVALMDSDDISLPERLQKQNEVLDSQPQIGVVSAWLEYFQNRQGLNCRMENPRLLDLYFKGSLISHPCVMMRKSVLDAHNLRYDEKYPPAEDFELWSRALQYTQAYNIQTVLLRYRWHGNNISATQSQRQKALAWQIRRNILDALSNDANVKQEISLA